MLHDKRRSHLLLIDVQEKLFAVMHEGTAMAENAARLLHGAAILGVPLTVSEQYRKGLGPTLEPLVAAAGDAPLFEKKHFSAARDPSIREHLAASAIAGRDHFVLAGIEAHVCVLQTALDMVAQGYSVSVVADAVTSRTPTSLAAALERMARAGIHIATVEMILFEWQEMAGNDTFRAISQLIK